MTTTIAPAEITPGGAPGPDRRRQVGGAGLLLAAAVGMLALGVALASTRAASVQTGSGTAVPLSATDTPVVAIAGPSELPPGPIEHVQVAYFHRTHRCSGCINAERLTRATLDQHFAERLAGGQMSLVVEDAEAPADPALVARYGAWGSALYLGVTKGGTLYTWRVDDVWFYVNQDHQFVSYLAGQIRDVLGGA